MNKIICPICEGKSKNFLKIKDFEIFKCENCSVSFLYPIPEKIEEIYNDDYFKKWYLRFYGERKKYFENIWEKIKNYIPDKGKVLDIGCGVGIWLEILKEKILKFMARISLNLRQISVGKEELPSITKHS